MSDTEAIVLSAVDESDPPERRALADVAVEGVLLLPNTAKLITRLVRDPRVSIRGKIAVAAASLYALSPIDIGPKSILGFGLVDDVIIVSLALNGLLATTDPDILREHWDGSIDGLDLAMSLARWGATMLPGRT